MQLQLETFQLRGLILLLRVSALSLQSLLLYIYLHIFKTKFESKIIYVLVFKMIQCSMFLYLI